MALNNTAADAAVDTWVASLSPAPANPTAVRDAMRPLVRAIYAGIVANAVIAPGTFVSDGDPVTGAGTVT
jgi:multidrug resistance efflux pump